MSKETRSPLQLFNRFIEITEGKPVHHQEIAEIVDKLREQLDFDWQELRDLKNEVEAQEEVMTKYAALQTVCEMLLQTGAFNGLKLQERHLLELVLHNLGRD